jgi:hypothetical protein
MKSTIYDAMLWIGLIGFLVLVYVNIQAFLDGYREGWYECRSRFDVWMVIGRCRVIRGRFRGRSASILFASESCPDHYFLRIDGGPVTCLPVSWLRT